MENFNLKSERGEGLFEMVMCIPIALLLLFTGVDVGLSKLDYALVVDAVREGIHNQEISDSKIYRISKGIMSVDQVAVVSTAMNIADRIAQNVSSKRLSLASVNGKDQIKVSITPIILAINPQTGIVVDYQRGAEVLSQLGNPSLNVASFVTKSNFSSDDYFISNQIKDTQSRGGFGIIKPSYQVSVSGTQDRFLDTGIAYLISVDVMSPSINPDWLKTNLGSELGYQIKELQLIRN